MSANRSQQDETTALCVPRVAPRFMDGMADAVNQEIFRESEAVAAESRKCEQWHHTCCQSCSFARSPFWRDGKTTHPHMREAEIRTSRHAMYRPIRGATNWYTGFIDATLIQRCFTAPATRTSSSRRVRDFVHPYHTAATTVDASPTLTTCSAASTVLSLHGSTIHATSKSTDPPRTSW